MRLSQTTWFSNTIYDDLMDRIKYAIEKNDVSHKECRKDIDRFLKEGIDGDILLGFDKIFSCEERYYTTYDSDIIEFMKNFGEILSKDQLPTGAQKHSFYYKAFTIWDVSKFEKRFSAFWKEDPELQIYTQNNKIDDIEKKDR